MDNGTVQIHGKEYKTVALRVKEFRKDHPDWGIVTQIIQLDEEKVVLKASVIDRDDFVIATGHAEEWRSSSMINKTSMVENAETSAVGRALAFEERTGSEIASVDEIETAKRKEKALSEEKEIKAERRRAWNTLNLWLDGESFAIHTETDEEGKRRDIRNDELREPPIRTYLMDLIGKKSLKQMSMEELAKVTDTKNKDKLLKIAKGFKKDA